MFLETSSARLPPPLAAGPPWGQCWDPHPQPRQPRCAGLDQAGDPPVPAGTSSPASPSLVPPQPTRPPRDAAGATLGPGSLRVSPPEPTRGLWSGRRSRAGHRERILNLALSGFLFYF